MIPYKTYHTARWAFILLSALFSACSYDNEEDLFGSADCSTQAVSLSDDIQPILSANCAIPGCHVPGGQLPAFTDTDVVLAHAADIRIRTSNGSMPPPSSGKELSSEQIRKISCWAENGAPDN